MTYAKLSQPRQFMPDEDVTFTFEYSTDMLGKIATLKVYGYSYTIDGITYTGTEQSTTLRAVWLGTGYEEFTIPANTLAKNPTTNDPIQQSGTVQAIVEISNEETSEVVFKSNVVNLNMLLKYSDDFQILNAPIIAKASTQYINIRYIARSTASGDYDNNAINSYCVLIYDISNNLLWQSEEMFDWENSSIHYKLYKLRDLPNYFDGYVQVRASLAGGFNIFTNKAALSVQYDSIPELSDHIELSAHNGQVKILIHNIIGTISVSRTVLNANDYVNLVTYNTYNDITILYDNYAIPNKTYLYRIDKMSGSTIRESYYQLIFFTMTGVHISDVTKSYHATVYDTLYPVTRNDRSGIFAPMDSIKSVAIINGLQNNDSGNVNALFTNEDECNLKFEDNSNLSVEMRKWLNNGKAKLLKYDNGEAWIVTTTSNTTNKNENGLYYTSFSWQEIGDINDVNEYVRLGLV